MPKITTTPKRRYVTFTTTPVVPCPGEKPPGMTVRDAELMDLIAIERIDDAAFDKSSTVKFCHPNKAGAKNDYHYCKLQEFYNDFRDAQKTRKTVIHVLEIEPPVNNQQTPQKRQTRQQTRQQNLNKKKIVAFAIWRLPRNGEKEPDPEYIATETGLIQEWRKSGDRDIPNSKERNNDEYREKIAYGAQAPVNAAFADTILLDDIGSDPDYKGKGYGKYLISHFLENRPEAKHKLCSLLSLETPKKFYEKLGFKQVLKTLEIRDNRKGQERAPVLQMHPMIRQPKEYGLGCCPPTLAGHGDGGQIDFDVDLSHIPPAGSGSGQIRGANGSLPRGTTEEAGIHSSWAFALSDYRMVQSVHPKGW